ncbi:uncharacterized protein [Haliotis cracherodii]|uniref:uncharacterized protein n=1 Tax=Haliotis cracherodii TaxID=6455 RepID=UPI0039ECBA84
MKKALPPGLKLVITVRFLASCDKYPSLMYSFRVTGNTISLIIPEVCQAIVEEYKDEVIIYPTTPDAWTPTGEVFGNRWNVPHAVGALDGKHVGTGKPGKSDSLYHNYKGFFSIFNELKVCLEDGSIGFPETSPIPQDDEPMPYVILGDDAFGIRTFLVKPYGHMNLQRDEGFCNYRISRGRRVVDNAFGILAQRWQILLTTMQPWPSIAQDIVSASTT